MNQDEAYDEGYAAGSFDGYYGETYDAYYNDQFPTDVAEIYRSAYSAGYDDGQDSYRLAVDGE